MSSIVDHKKIAYNLKRPCDDCPFKKGARWHTGVVKSLPLLHSRMERGLFVHSCHKTDPQSDGFNENFKGAVEHCAGALLMLKNDDEYKHQTYHILAQRDGRYKPDALINNGEAFESVGEMINHYVAMMREKYID